MAAAAAVDLEALKARLAKLGVHIDDAPAASKQPEQPQPQPQPPGTSWESRLQRSSKEVALLLQRCSKVQRALNNADASEVAAGASTSSRGKLAAAVAAAAPLDAASRGAGKAPAQGRAGGRPASSSAAAAAAGAGSAVASAATSSGSKLLERAAQRLLEEGRGQAARPASSRALVAGRPARPSAAAASAAGAEDLRSSPLGTVLSQYKEAQSAWAQEKAKLRRDAVAARKQAAKLELELAKHSRQQQHRAAELASLRAALKGRDVQLEEAHARARQLQDALAHAQEVAAEKLCGLQAERDDLQALLLATLQRLEGVEAVVAAADATSAAMEEQVRLLEAERQQALDAAATARAEVEQLQEAQQRLQWQSQLLQKMSEVQLRHNQRKSAAIQDLLSSTCAHRSGGSGGDAAAAATAALEELLGVGSASDCGSDDSSSSSGGSDDEAAKAVPCG